MQPAIYPRIRSEAEVLCAFGDITGLQQVQRCVKTPRVQVFGTGWVLMVASYGCKNIKKGATGDLAERRCTAASLGDFLWDDIRCMRLKWWTFIEKRRWQLTQLLPNQSRGRLHIKSDHKHLFDEFHLLAVWRYPSDFFFCPAWATLRLFCTAAEQDAGLVGVGMGFSEACGWNKWMSLNDLMIHDRNVRHAN